ncbi:WecB/TagA/CpsF family glycosyltransferase [Lactobacillus xylocopicola]|uniref:N-acetylglucosaminyldiphosphoundecaprenol N-acetyl-beta-D-mannosaminyltransferase n=1 Tax=Lactobacillus xylocopicola TaxID=2976676 RepID=A0ABM8BFP4_9LACO|nr:WecB/TagA/CpsF family glycosyltransferase [Lactobacillus xylocopicola]BDR60077.1 acetylglucosaminyldiphosphoundecaprenol acetyl-beta-D-mannosaminyltransferase [Lactobacillus xylocopicola]
MDKVNVLGVDFDNKSFKQFQSEFSNRIDSHQSTLVVTANPEIVMTANENPEFMKILRRTADYITPDGIGIIKAGKILGTPLKERVTGYDLFVWLLKVANEQKLRIYLVGAKPEVLAAVQERIGREYGGIDLVGAEDGYFDDDLEIIAYQIKQKQPDLVFAALGSPRQEQLLTLLRRDRLAALMMGVGGSFDVFSGKVKRAPQFWQKLHLEWLYRLLKNPRRFKRILVLPQFVLEVYHSRTGKR